MTNDSPFGSAHRPGLVWGFHFAEGAMEPIQDQDLMEDRGRPGGFTWLHFNLADQRTQRWLAASAPLPKEMRELFLSIDMHQRYAAADGMLGCVLHDVEQDFHEVEPNIGVLRFAVGRSLMITARHHPIRSAERVRQRILNGGQVADAVGALDLLFAAMSEVQRAVVTELDDAVQTMEDDLLANRPAPEARAFLSIRSIMVRQHRALSGMRTVLNRLDDDAAVSAPMIASVVRFAHRVAASDAELLTIQSQLRLLREELDLQAAQRTNQTLNTLSILSALLLPATLVTGIFGMNTGGFPWAQDRAGTLYATLLAIGASAAVYLALRLSGRLKL